MEFVRPTLLLDKDICLKNIERMAEKAKSKKLIFRPHFKTHQSAIIGDWFRKYGVEAITVSSVQMATYFSYHGWTDITIAFPVNFHEINQINKLSQEISLNIVVENKESINYLNKFLKFPVGVFIKIDTGFNRSGILAGRYNTIDGLLKFINENKHLQFKGFLSHTGHTYNAKSRHEIFNRHFDALLKMRSLKNHYKKKYPNMLVSIGDTPSASICENFEGVDEIRPGNFVFYDLMQYQLGVCHFDDIAVRLVCPIVAKHPSRNEVVIYGGAIHISKDSITNIDGKELYGQIVINKNDKKVLLDERNYLCKLSQEHGIIKATHKDFNDLNIGDWIEIIPVHSCLTANLMGKYTTTNGETIPMMGSGNDDF